MYKIHPKGVPSDSSQASELDSIIFDEGEKEDSHWDATVNQATANAFLDTSKRKYGMFSQEYRAPLTPPSARRERKKARHDSKSMGEATVPAPSREVEKTPAGPGENRQQEALAGAAKYARSRRSISAPKWSEESQSNGEERAKEVHKLPILPHGVVSPEAVRLEPEKIGQSTRMTRAQKRAMESASRAAGKRKSQFTAVSLNSDKVGILTTAHGGGGSPFATTAATGADDRFIASPSRGSSEFNVTSTAQASETVRSINHSATTPHDGNFATTNATTNLDPFIGFSPGRQKQIQGVLDLEASLIRIRRFDAETASLRALGDRLRTERSDFNKTAKDEIRKRDAEVKRLSKELQQAKDQKAAASAQLQQKRKELDEGIQKHEARMNAVPEEFGTVATSEVELTQKLGLMYAEGGYELGRDVERVRTRMGNKE